MDKPRTICLTRVGQLASPAGVWTLRDGLCEHSDADVLAWGQDHPELARWTPEQLADDARLWLAPVDPDADPWESSRFTLRSGSALDAEPGWLALMGATLTGRATALTRPHDHGALHALPELLACGRLGWRRVLASWVPAEAFED